MTTADSHQQYPAKISSCSCSLYGSLSLPLTETEKQVIFNQYIVYCLRAIELLRRIQVTKWKVALARRNLSVSRAQRELERINTLSKYRIKNKSRTHSLGSVPPPKTNSFSLLFPPLSPPFKPSITALNSSRFLPWRTLEVIR